MTEPNNILPKGAFVIGEGVLSAWCCLLLGGLSLAGVIAFMFPAYFTTPSLRANYDPELWRDVMAAGLIASAFFGAFALYRGAKSRIALIGLLLGAVAMAFGGPNVSVGSLEPTPFHIGIDWFIIGLLTTGGAFILLEKIAPIRPDQPVLREGWLLDMKHFLAYHLSLGGFLFVTNFVIHQFFGWMIVPVVGETIRQAPFWLQFALILVAVDMAQYWVHRLYHSGGFFWRVHAVHHSADHMDWMASSRLNIVEALITRTLGLLAITALGFDQGPVNAYILFIGVHATFIHANVRFEFGWLEHIFVTPRHHHWHHSTASEAMNKNFAVHLSVFDRFFGTLYAPKSWPEEYGVVGEQPPTSFRAQQIYPFKG